MSDLGFVRHARLRPPARGWDLVATAIDDDEACVCLWSFNGKYRLTTDPTGVDGCELDGSNFRSPQIGQLADGALLVTNSRAKGSHRIGPGATVSSWTFSPSGQVTAEGTLGDGIQSVLTTPTGDIWVSYFDEGVYGGGPLAQHGLVRFGPDLSPLWLYRYGASHGEIDDCYALNVFGETAVAYFYRDFNIVQVRGETLSSWTGAPRGATGLLISGDRCVLIGGYEEASDGISNLRLTSAGAELESRGEIAGLPARGRVSELICRGADAHVIVGTDWFRATIT